MPDAAPAAMPAAPPASAPPPAATLVILRGNSASGKSTVARRVQRSLPRGRVAVIGQDHLRRELLWEHDVTNGDTAGLILATARHCLGIGRITVVEGIFGSERYGEMFEELLAEHDGPSLVYYLDVSLEETLRRHAGKTIGGEVPASEVASWYREHDVLGAPGEQVLGEELSEDAMVARVHADLRTTAEH